MKYEDDLDIEFIAGIDEVGRGCLAGPVVAAAVVMPKDRIDGIKDSKKLSKKRREELNELILDKALAYGFGIVSNDIIDEINIKQATRKAMAIALNEVEKVLKPELVLVDAEVIQTSLPQEALIKGDDISYNIEIGRASCRERV